jgi:flagellar biosynthesis anti-sigma factor FlgM
MKISDLHQQANTAKYINQTNPSKQSDKSLSSHDVKDNLPPKDRVDLSAQSKEMQKMYEVLQATPDVRAEKVAQYKKSIEEAKYRVSPDDLADKMLKESLLDLI